MSATLLTGPAVEPVPLADAKSYLRIEHAADDDALAALIAGARIHVETQTRRALITQVWRLTRDAWPADGRIAVTPAPLRALVAARIYKVDGTALTLSTAAFAADTAGAPAVLAFAPGTFAAPGRVVAGIELDVEVGYGGAPSDVPQPLRQAIRALVAHWYEHRGVTAAGAAIAALPESVAALLRPYRVLAL
jgi:uncharacterized phiE125 gp8 family phage protein